MCTSPWNALLDQEGKNSLIIRTMDKAGNWSSESSITVIRDTQ